jgi:para-aminobenzoate synthetase component 1
VTQTALHARELPHVPDGAALVAALREQGLAWWLDSALACGARSRFSFAGADPYQVLRTWGAESRLACRRALHAGQEPGEAIHVVPPLALVRSLLPAPPAPRRGDPPVPFVGGAVGYFGYELAARLESGPLSPCSPACAPAPAERDDSGLPDLTLLFVDRLVAIDHRDGRAWVIGLGFSADLVDAQAAALAACRALEPLARATLPVPRCRASAAPEPPAESTPEARSPDGLATFFGERSYARVVAEILDEIEAGNVYQVNLTHRMDVPLPGVDPFALYCALRAGNPAPFAAYLELPDAAILSSSPERFLRLDAERRVESRPIKGTRPRDVPGSRGDARLAAELVASAKDRAENLMIVDLVRNDLGRVCEIGSISVPELMAVESYATVHQLVSTVRGRLRADRDGLDLLAAAFPPGSMTGAPKLAAMQLIDRLEPVRRGVYSGALGYLDVRGGLDLSVVIRTLIVAREHAQLHVGGGVVADSDPVAEYRETLDKARALLAALARVAPSGARAREPAAALGPAGAHR